MANKLEKELARFEKKGPRIKVMEHAIFDRNGELVQEGKFDIMEDEFRCYKFSGNALANDTLAQSCAQLQGSEEEFFELGKQARDDRLVITSSGTLARAVGGLGDGTGYLVDANGRPIGRTPQAPVTPMRRKAEDW